MPRSRSVVAWTEALRVMNIICALVATSYVVLCLQLPIAFKPSGVAALSRPKALAEKFIKIEPIAGWFLDARINAFERMD